MSVEKFRGLGLNRGGARRKAVRINQSELVGTSLLLDGELPLLVEPTSPEIRLGAWGESNRETIYGWLRKHGGILFRGFDVPDVGAFQDVVRAISGELLEYKERSSPRHAVAGNVYTSTDYPPEQPIFLHNENSYQNTWPMRVYFYCDVEPRVGGATPLADVRKIYQRLDPRIRERFEEKRWSYVRNFGDGFGLPWQTVFGTEDKDTVAAHCAKNGIELEWRPGNRLRTRSVRPAVSVHPETGEKVWFNHATFFHVSTLVPTVRDGLLKSFAIEDLPTNTYYGDGDPIEAETLEELRRVYGEETVRFPWRKGDVLMLDNMLVAHGREPFEGERKVLVGMADPCSWDSLEA